MKMVLQWKSQRGWEMMSVEDVNGFCVTTPDRKQDLLKNSRQLLRQNGNIFFGRIRFRPFNDTWDHHQQIKKLDMEEREAGL